MHLSWCILQWNNKTLVVDTCEIVDHSFLISLQVSRLGKLIADMTKETSLEHPSKKLEGVGQEIANWKMKDLFPC